MDLQTFEKQLADLSFYEADNQWILFKDPWRWLNMATGEEFPVKDLTEAAAFDLGNGRTLSALIAPLEKLEISFDD